MKYLNAWRNDLELLHVVINLISGREVYLIVLNRVWDVPFLPQAAFCILLMVIKASAQVAVCSISLALNCVLEFAAAIVMIVIQM